MYVPHFRYFCLLGHFCMSAQLVSLNCWYHHAMLFVAGLCQKFCSVVIMNLNFVYHNMHCAFWWMVTSLTGDVIALSTSVDHAHFKICSCIVIYRTKLEDFVNTLQLKSFTLFHFLYKTWNHFNLFMNCIQNVL